MLCRKSVLIAMRISLLLGFEVSSLTSMSLFGLIVYNELSKSKHQFKINRVNLSQLTSQSVRDSESFEIAEFEIAHGKLI